MALLTQRQGQIGVNVVERIILKKWNSRWQPIDAVNDDGIDGLVFLESGGEFTGQIIFAQVKCQKYRLDSQNRLCIGINSKKLSRLIEQWRRVIGAAILIHVDPKDLKARWVNVRDPAALGDTQVFIPEDNYLDTASRKAIAKLAGTIHRDILAKRVIAEAGDFEYLRVPLSLQPAARKYYRGLAVEGVKFKNSTKKVRFSKDGWKHITRHSRRRLVQLQSFNLLGVVRRIIRTLEEDDFRPITPARGEPVKFVYVNAAVSFPFRQAAIVKVLLRRHGTNPTSYDYSFYTVYEPRRKRDAMGMRVDER